MKSDDELLSRAASVLASAPGSSMQAVAEAIGMSRATLHRRYPTRDDLICAIANLALAELEGRTATVEQSGLLGLAAFDQLVLSVVPLAPRFGFLHVEASLVRSEPILERFQAVLERWVSIVEQGQRSGEIRVDLPARWIVASFEGLLNSGVDGVWFGIFGERDIPRLIRATLLTGIVAPNESCACVPTKNLQTQQRNPLKEIS